MTFLTDFVTKYTPSLLLPCTDPLVNPAVGGQIDDVSGNSRHAIVQNIAATEGAPALFPQDDTGLNLSSNSWAKVTYGSWASPTNFTAMVWFRVATSGPQRNIFCRYDLVTTNGGWSIRADSLTVSLYNFKASWNSQLIIPTLTLGQTYRVVVRWNGTRYRYNIDGGAGVDWTPSGGGPTASTVPISLGAASSAGGGEFHDGPVRLAAFWERELSDTEVSDSWTEANLWSTAPATISDLGGVAAHQRIQTSFTAAARATSYEYRLNGGAATALAGSKLITGLTNGTPYDVEVRGVNNIGGAAWSNLITRTPVLALLEEDFNRANNASVVGSPSVGPAPVVQTGTMGITTNQLYASALTATQAIVTWDVGTLDFDVSFLAPVHTGLSFVFGYVGLTDFWLVTVVDTDFTLYRREIGGFMQYQTFITGAPFTSVALRKRITYDDNVVRVYIDTTQVLNCRISTPGSTKIGIRMTNTATRVDEIIANPYSEANPTMGSTGAVVSDPMQEFTRAFHDNQIIEGGSNYTEDALGVVPA